jgi:hypothetical protein
LLKALEPINVHRIIVSHAAPHALAALGRGDHMPCEWCTHAGLALAVPMHRCWPKVTGLGRATEPQPRRPLWHWDSV